MKLNAIVCAIALAMAGIVHADTTVKIQAGDEQNKHDIVTYVAAGKVRYDMPGGHGYSLWDSASKTMTMVMTKDKRYMVMDEAYMQQMAKMTAQMAGVMAQMGNNAMFGDMAKKMQGAQQEVNKVRSYKKTSRTDTAMNKTCKVWEVYVEQVKEGEFCTVAASTMNYSSDDIETFKAMGEFGKRMAESMKGAMKMPGMPETKQPEFAQIFDGNEFPIKYVRTDKEKPYTAMEYKEINHNSIDASLFAIPAGFQKMDMKMGR